MLATRCRLVCALLPLLAACNGPEIHDSVSSLCVSGMDDRVGATVSYEPDHPDTIECGLDVGEGEIELSTTVTLGRGNKSIATPVSGFCSVDGVPPGEYELIFGGDVIMHLSLPAGGRECWPEEDASGSTGTSG